MILLAFLLFLMFLVNAAIIAWLSDTVSGDLGALFVWIIILAISFYADARFVDWLINTKHILS